MQLTTKAITLRKTDGVEYRIFCFSQFLIDLFFKRLKMAYKIEEFIKLWNGELCEREETMTWFHYWVTVLLEVGLENSLKLKDGMKKQLSLHFNKEEVKCIMYYIHQTFYFSQSAGECEWRESYIRAMDDIMEIDLTDIKYELTQCRNILKGKYDVMQTIYNPEMYKMIVEEYGNYDYKYSF